MDNLAAPTSDLHEDWRPGRRPDRRLAALGATALVHALLVLGWMAPHRPPPAQPDGPRMGMQWVRLAPPPQVAPQVPPVDDPLPRLPAPSRSAPPLHSPRLAPPVASPAPPFSAAPAAPVAAAAPAPVPPAASAILERARRDVGAIDRALRKENKPLIVAPPDSPQLRLQRGIEHAAEMAPNAWYQAPKMAELVNQTGDGARRERIITGNGTYCSTERAPTTNVEMIEMHGKIRITTCPEHEAPPQRQAWRTARDPY